MGAKIKGYSGTSQTAKKLADDMFGLLDTRVTTSNWSRVLVTDKNKPVFTERIESLRYRLAKAKLPAADRQELERIFYDIEERLIINYLSYLDNKQKIIGIRSKKVAIFQKEYEEWRQKLFSMKRP